MSSEIFPMTAIRHDSGGLSPQEISDRLVEACNEQGLDPKNIVLMIDEPLTVEDVKDLHHHLSTPFKTAFGIRSDIHNPTCNRDSLAMAVKHV